MTQIGINWVQAQETVRHNYATEQLEREKVDVSKFTAFEAMRHNVALENLSSREIAVKERQQTLAETRYREVDKPVAMSTISLNRAKASEAEAHAALYREQKTTEWYKQQVYSSEYSVNMANEYKSRQQGYAQALESSILKANYKERISAEHANYLWQGSGIPQSIGAVATIFGGVGSVVASLMR